MLDRSLRECDHVVRQSSAIDLRPGNPMVHPIRVLNADLIDRLAVAIIQAEAMPPRRDYRVHSQLPPPDLEAQDFFNPDPVHPSGRACVPGPATPTAVAGKAIHIACDDIRLNAITLDLVRFAGPFDGVEHLHQPAGPIAVTRPGPGHRPPNRGAGVLPAVLAHP